MSYRVTRVHRSAIPIGVDCKLMGAKVGDCVHLTLYGVESDAVITELTRDWVEFRTGDEVST